MPCAGAGLGSASGGRGETALGGAGETARCGAGAWSSMETVPLGIHGDAPPAVSQGRLRTGLLAVSRTRPAATTRTMRASPTAATQAP